MDDLAAQSTFGACRPHPVLRLILSVSRRLPAVWPGRPLASLLRRIARPVLADAVDVEVFRRRMRLRPSDNICEKRVLFTPQFFDPAERRFLKRIAKPGFVFVDIGANVGAYSLIVAAACDDQTRIVAAEPDPVIRSRLEFNCAANQTMCIDIVSAAVSDVNGELELHLNTVNRGQNSIVAGEGESVRVPSLTLKTILDQRGIERTDCLKLDIEGAEHLVLSRFFEEADKDNYPRYVIIEQIRRQPLTPAAHLLLEHGYRVLRRTRMNLILEYERVDATGQTDRAAA
jgi:FkbM family methyltransferase